MTTTISRLYNSHAEARAAVRDLEAAGVDHSDISIIASNADNWYYAKNKTYPIVISTAAMTVLKPQPPAAALVRWQAAPQAF
jgi:hypothetical protein